MDKLSKPYFFVVGVAAVALIFVLLSRTSDQRINQVYSQPATLQSSSSTQNEITTNIPETDPDYQELTNVVAQSGTTDSDSTTQNQQPAASTTGNYSVAAYNQVNGFLEVFGAIINGALVGDSTTFNTPVSQSDGSTIIIATPVTKPGLVDKVNGTTFDIYTTKSASVIAWADDLRNRIDPVQTTYAQDTTESPTYFPGQGYNLLSPVLNLWKTTSNIVYIFYIVIIVAIAFLIVFRTQLDGQNAVTLFNAIPSIIISLLLVYFSYPISALFIDLITIGSGVTYGVLVGNTPASAGGTAPGAFLLDDKLRTAFPNSESPFGESFNPATGLQIDDTYLSVWRSYFTAGINPTTGGASKLIPEDAIISELIRNLAGSLGDSGLGDIIITLIFAFAVFSTTLRLFFKLLGEYVILNIYVVLAPFLFLFAAIPGRTGSVISSYFLRLLAAAVSFIVVYAVFLLVLIIANTPIQVGDIVWTPPLLGYRPYRVLGSDQFLNYDIVRPVLAYGLFVATPLILDTVKQAITQGQDSPFGEDIKKTTQGGLAGVLSLGSVVNRGLREASGQPNQ